MLTPPSFVSLSPQIVDVQRYNNEAMQQMHGVFGGNNGEEDEEEDEEEDVGGVIEDLLENQGQNNDALALVGEKRGGTI